MKKTFTLIDTRVDMQDFENAKKQFETIKEPTDEEVLDRAYEEKEWQYGDFMEQLAELDKQVVNPIIAIYSLGLWNGVAKGCCLLSSLKEIADVGRSIEDVKFYVENKNLKCMQFHHDGTNYITFRELKPNISDYLYEKICEGSKKHIEKYTSSLGRLFK